MRNILILENRDKSYRSLFAEYGKIITDHRQVEDCDLVVFTGGSDVSPNLYGDTKLESTFNSPSRDELEQTVYNLAYLLSIPMVGICRGMQFLTVMNGGVLIQDINNHSNCVHEIVTSEGETFNVTGDHHQMCIPLGEYELLSWANEMSTYFKGGGIGIDQLILPLEGKEPEAAYWPKSNSLGVQYHPEWMGEETRGYEYFCELINKYIFNQE